MENGSNSPCLEDELLDHAENGVVSPIMVKTLEEENDNTDKNSPNEVTSHFENTKANGDNITDIDNTENDSYTSESDALVIDESVPKKFKKLKNTQQQSLVSVNEDHLFDNNEFVTHSNPFFNESLFELSQLHQVPDAEEILNGSNILEGPSDNNCVKQKDKKLKCKPKPKLREYTQYLGLQPTVQFKCSKCGRAGFESLSTLQDHVNQCNEKSVQETSGDDSCSGFKLTRKVFLCSACGTYYENWNLYVHMLEIHKRFICLYCLGMFSILEDLCQHLQSRHNLQPGHKNTLDEFFNVYKEPCYVICCECNKLFSEQDNFFDHNCVGKVKNKKLTKQHITPENHVTGESESVLDNPGEVIKNHSSQVSCNNSLKNNHIGDNKTPTENITMETNENMTVVANEEHEGGCQVHVNDKKHVANDACENNLEENHLESSFEQDENTDIKEAEPECTREAENSSKIDMEDFLENGEVENKEEESEEVPVETRKVPKLSLKIPKFETYPEPDADESDDSEKLTMEVDQIESENDDPENMNECKTVNDISNTDQEKEIPDAENPVEEQQETKNDSQYHIAGSEIPVIELELEQPLDKFDPCVLLQKCLKMTVASCIYCNHARKIAVNGRQLGLHCIAEHRFSAVVNSITAEELIPMSFVNKIKDSLEELERTFFNLETNFSGEAVTFSHLFECLQCYFSTNVHKELYLHNRKFHSKNLLLCIMCKSNFYSYSELICHLCPGQYIIDYNMKFRCCMCVNDDLPSSFRLIVHLRKRHNTCDVCLEMCNTQTRLSNHVWKHKLHHFCYRCGIAYRNKMDIMRHLFWKHGTESVQCKKCLQKKWPHVYHFCVPPASFSCDECLMTFSRAVNLKVHKRIHAEEKKWSCTFEGCEEGFISKKLMEKHEKKHYDPPEEAVVEENAQRDSDNVRGDEESTRAAKTTSESDKPEDKPKQMIDVLDLPALNLSESDSSDSEPEKDPIKPVEEVLKSNQIVADTELDPPGDLPPLDILQEDESSSAVMQNIWDNFKNYQESKNKLDIMFGEGDKVEEKVNEIPVPVVEEELTAEVALRDHDYFVEPPKDAMIVEVKPALNESIDHDYCSAKSEGTVAEQPTLDPPPLSPQNNAKPFTVASATKRDSSSSSSSDTDSSSCSCGSNCSCKSSSGSSSSSSDSSNSDSSTEEGRKKQMARRLKRRERAKKMKVDVEEDKKVVDVVTTDLPSAPIDTPIRESDLETTESETDEEFYDEAPQKFAKKILDEKRQQLLELLGPNSVPNGGFIESTSRPPTPPAGVVEEEERKKKKSKSKKRKKRKSERKDPSDRPITTPPPILPTASIISPDIPIPPYYQQFHQQLQLQQQQQPTVAPITLSLSRSSPAPVAATATPPTGGRREAVDSSLRASKRRRVPNKFYGYSSDEDKEKEKTPHVPKWKKVESGHQPNTTPQLVPPITIKTTPAPAPTPTVEPISIRTAAHLSDFRVRRPRPRPTMPPIRLGGRAFAASPTERDSGSESNDSSSDEEEKEETQAPPKPAQPQLYCYCQCPYDEVSEMIGCDASDCAIEWFHFECVGIMVPPKGQWYCPDCRKKKARRELMQNMKNN